MVPSTEATAYKAHIWALARSSGLAAPTVAPVSVELILRPVRPKDAAKRERLLGAHWWHDVRRIDLGNCEKVAGDALQGIAYENDRQIVRLHMEVGEPTEGGALEVSWAEWRPLGA